MTKTNSPSSPSPPAASWSEPHSRCPQTGRSSSRACCRSEAEGEAKWRKMDDYEEMCMNGEDEPPLSHSPFVWSSAGCSAESSGSLPRDFWKCSGWPVVVPCLSAPSSWKKVKYKWNNFQLGNKILKYIDIHCFILNVMHIWFTWIVLSAKRIVSSSYQSSTNTEKHILMNDLFHCTYCIDTDDTTVGSLGALPLSTSIMACFISILL